MSENFNVTILYGTVSIVFFLVFCCFVCLIIFYCSQDITVAKLFIETISSLGWYFHVERVFDCLCQGFEEAPPSRISSVQSLSRVQHFATLWTAACQASLSIINSQSLLKVMSIELVMPSNHLILCRPLLLLPSIFHSIGVFSNESVLPNQVAKVLEFQLQHQSFQWTFRTDFI